MLRWKNFVSNFQYLGKQIRDGSKFIEIILIKMEKITTHFYQCVPSMIIIHFYLISVYPFILQNNKYLVTYHRPTESNLWDYRGQLCE